VLSFCFFGVANFNELGGMMMRKWQGLILIVLALLATTAAGYVGQSVEQVDKIAPPPAWELVNPIEGM